MLGGQVLLWAALFAETLFNKSNLTRCGLPSVIACVDSTLVKFPAVFLKSCRAFCLTRVGYSAHFTITKSKRVSL